ncbi:MAG: pectin esterase [Fibrobacteres bacterium]|nr:pectin esterase [Fibrobacterota bacterium]
MNFARIAMLLGMCTLVQAQDGPIGFASLEGEGDKRVVGGTTGGKGGKIVTVTNAADLEKNVTATEPMIVLVSGTIKVTPSGKEFKVASDKTILGLGANATISGGGFFLGAGVHNVIIRNLTIGDTKDLVADPTGKELDYDGVQMDQAHHVWIDHCQFRDINDGMIDSRKDTDYLTVSWNKFFDHNKVFGIGWTENMISKITIHHNWFKNVVQRNPSCDNATCHLFNNYLDGVESYGNYSRGVSDMLIENSVFRNAKDPWYHDATAKLTARGNTTEGTITGQKTATGTATEMKKFYAYTLDPVAEVKAILAESSGPQASIGKAPTAGVSGRTSQGRIGLNSQIAVDPVGRVHRLGAGSTAPSKGIHWVREANGETTTHVDIH